MTQVKVNKHTKGITADVIHLLKADHKRVKDLLINSRMCRINKT
jgi:hypothetical protein